MSHGAAIRDDYLTWLRGFPLMRDLGRPSDAPEAVPVGDTPVSLDHPFWSRRTHETEARAGEHLSDREIDLIFDEVASVIDEDLRRFDPMIAYYGRFFPDGDEGRIDDERQAAHSVKRDLAWAAVERSIGHPEFFARLLPWYNEGRWPYGWEGEYPAGHIIVL